MTTKPRGRAFRRQFLPLLRKQSGLEILHFFLASQWEVAMLAPYSPQGLIPSSGHANMARIFSACRRPCWRPVLRKALFLRQITPTRPGFSRPAGALVGALFPQRPYFFVQSRQPGPVFPGLPAPMQAPLLAPYSPQRKTCIRAAILACRWASSPSASGC